MRLDLFLAGKNDIVSRSAAKRLIENGCVRVNGKKTSKISLDVTSADAVTYTLPSPPIPTSTHTSLDLPILYEDDLCLVIDKPSGLVMHPGAGMKSGTMTLLDALEPLFAKRALPFSPSSVLVHRLDKDTTGCLLVAKTPKAHIDLQEQFAKRETHKTYLALVAGTMDPLSAVIDIPLGRDANTRTKMSVHRAVSSRSARTTYRTLAAEDGTSLLACELHTGRTHQIRVHLATLHHPVLGDETYGTEVSRVLSKKFLVPSIQLHAWKLSFVSPATKKSVSVKAPLPLSLSTTLETLGMSITD